MTYNVFSEMLNPLSQSISHCICLYVMLLFMKTASGLSDDTQKCIVLLNDWQTTALWPLCSSVCISWYPKLRTGNFVGAKLYCPHALLMTMSTFRLGRRRRVLLSGVTNTASCGYINVQLSVWQICSVICYVVTGWQIFKGSESQSRWCNISTSYTGAFFALSVLSMIQ